MANEEYMDWDESLIDPGKITETELSREIRRDFLDYSMSVIVARALPDVRDGLKPVQRRILFSMREMNNGPDKPYKKCARIVGDTMGKYHPHGDSSIYGALVYMAQNWNMRKVLVDGHGNFGDMDGDGAAAMRYTEARMSKIAVEMLRDLDKDTVDMQDNYDGEEKEPSVLPARFPNLLVNGGQGIAVGMATNVAPHNLGEIIEGIFSLMDNPDMTVVQLMKKIKGPDFPTGGYILGYGGIRKAFETGKGSIIMRAKTIVEPMENGKQRILVTQLPYQVNKAEMVKRIAQLARDKVIEGLSDLRDESNMDGVRVVIELKKDIQPEVILNQLYRLSPLQATFAVNNVVLINGAPKQCGIIEILTEYISFQKQVIRRRAAFDLKKAQDRAHILEGLRIAVDHLDAIIHTIRSSKDPNEAIVRLIDGFSLDEIQAKAILDMQFRRLTGLEREKIENEYQDLLVQIANLKDILAHEARVEQILRDELLTIKEKFDDPRRTEILNISSSVEDEDLIPMEKIIVTLSANGYIKRIGSSSYKVQKRGGKGIKGMALHTDDVIDQFVSLSTHDYLLLFTNTGRVYRLKGYNIPAYSRTSKGIPVVNLLRLNKEEKVRAIVPYAIQDEAKALMIVSSKGLIKRMRIGEFKNINRKGKIAMSLREHDTLAFVKATGGEADIMIGCSNGKAIRFHEQDIRFSGRTSMGVKAMNTEGGSVIGLATSEEGHHMLTVSEDGYGKLTELAEYRLTKRGGKGIKAMNITSKTGALVCMRVVTGEEDLMIMTDDGIIIRISMDPLRSLGRNTQGVRLIRIDEGRRVSAVAVVEPDMEEDEADTVQ